MIVVPYANVVSMHKMPFGGLCKNSCEKRRNFGKPPETKCSLSSCKHILLMIVSKTKETSFAFLHAILA